MNNAWRGKKTIFQQKGLADPGKWKINKSSKREISSIAT